MWKEIKNIDDLPPAGKYVLARHNRETWSEKTDPENANCVVVKLVRGISIEEREKMKSGEIPDPMVSFHNFLQGDGEIRRSKVYQTGDQDGNNLVPYYWMQFGPDKFFGQDITHYQLIEPL